MSLMRFTRHRSEFIPENLFSKSVIVPTRASINLPARKVHRHYKRKPIHYHREPTSHVRIGRPRKQRNVHKWIPRIGAGAVRQYKRRIGKQSHNLGSAVRAYQRKWVREWRKQKEQG